MRYQHVEGYRYRTVDIEIHDVPELAHFYLTAPFISLWGGVIKIDVGYAWDGASGPAINTKNFRRGSLVHDALYQLMRNGAIPRGYRDTADKILRRMCLEDKMCAPRAWWVYHFVKAFGGGSVKPNLKSKRGKIFETGV